MISHHEMVNGADPDLSEELLAVLPPDPYEQLDVAKKITAMAVASRLSKLEAETGKLRQKVTEKEHIILGLQESIGELERTLQENEAHLSLALDEQAKLAMDKENLASSVKKLTRDVAKLETFKRALMQSLQEDDDIPSQPGSSEKLPANLVASRGSSLSSIDSLREAEIAGVGAQSQEDRNAEFGSSKVASSKYSLVKNDENHSEADVSRPPIRRAFTVTPPHLTPPHLTPPQLTPTGSPKKQSAASSPRQQPVVGSLSASGSPKRYSAGEVKTSFHSSHPSSKRTTAPNSPPGGSLPARTPRVDGKEFFRQARNRLSYEQFSAFLTNIKELNAHRQTREETLRKADEIFGADNKDLYTSFESLLSRHLPNQA